ncbi:N-acetylmuramoyl-L-alanine amidase family protein, partial [Liquorilactobacillus ghanensis]|uniref:N-acetylmuramoyl-L-alanine amidase family protein n=2 Tax=Liquorilactobacillus ghanensis TaxID=399370 RepID=UPI0039EB9D7F
MKYSRFYRLLGRAVVTAAIILVGAAGESAVQAADDASSSSMATVTASVSSSSSSLTTAPTASHQSSASSSTSSATANSTTNANRVYSTNSNDVTNAQNQLKQAQTAASRASSQLSSATTAKNNAQTAVNNLKDQQTNNSNGSQINLTNDQKTKIATNWSTLDEGPAAKTAFADNESTDKSTKIDANNLTQSQAATLSAYAAGLINNLRGQLDYNTLNNQRAANDYYRNTSVVVTPGAINFAKQVAANYNSDHWNGYTQGNHDVPAIQKAAAANGLDQGANYYEDMESFSVNYATDMTLYAAKNYLYNAIYDMLFNDASEAYAHAHSILGLDITASEGITEEYFAVSFDQYGNVHLELIKPDYVSDQTKFKANFDTTPLAANQDQITAAQAALNKATANYNTALAAYNTANQQLQQAQAALTTAQNHTAKNGQFYENGHWYLYQNGIKKTGFQSIADQHKTVYYNSQGQMQYGQQKLNGHWYLFDSATGAMKTGFQSIANQHKTVYYNNQGQMQYGQQKLNGHWYLFDSATGAMKTGFQSIANQHKTVYYNNQGQMQYGQQKLNGHWYLFDNVTGAMKTGFQSIANQHKTVY